MPLVLVFTLSSYFLFTSPLGIFSAFPNTSRLFRRYRNGFIGGSSGTSNSFLFTSEYQPSIVSAAPQLKGVFYYVNEDDGYASEANLHSVRTTAPASATISKAEPAQHRLYPGLCYALQQKLRVVLILHISSSVSTTKSTL